MKAGIYRIRHADTGKVYVGSAANIRARFSGHRRALMLGRHGNARLQNAWNKHGAEAFTFEVIEYCAAADLLVREQHWLDATGCVDARHGYNIAPKAGSQLGVRFPPEVRARMGRPRGLPMAPETRAALAAARVRTTSEMALKAWATRRERGTDKWTDERRARRSEAYRGRTLTAEHRANIGAAGKGRKRPDTATRLRLMWEDPLMRARIGAKISAALRGRVFTEDHKQKISATVKQRHAEGVFARSAK